MVAVSFYFQVHQPFRLRRDFDFFSIGSGTSSEDEKKNRDIMMKVAEKCYLPTNAVMLDLIRKTDGRFRISYSISGVALEQFALYDPRVLESFRKLEATGAVEFIGETYYHSLAFLFSQKEFRRQIRLHQEALKTHLGVEPRTFRNTELIYNNEVAKVAESLGFSTILAEGADRVLGWRSPNFVYRPAGTKKIKLLLKNYRLSDDIAFRFSNRDWSEWPLTADKFARWLESAGQTGETINLFMDYETFGEHQWESTGIFEFLKHLPDQVLSRPGFSFMTPGEVAVSAKPVAVLDVPEYVSWADTERDVSAWLGNHMQDAAAASVFAMEKDVMATRDPKLIHDWAKMTTSDHFYYMCTKWFQDGDVHKYFNPYESPYDAFIVFANAQNELKWRIAEANKARRAEKRAQLVERRREGLRAMPSSASPRPSFQARPANLSTTVL